MPCLMLDKSTTTRLANTLADLITRNPSPSTVAGYALQASPLAHAIPHNANDIARALHTLNSRAYWYANREIVAPWPELPTMPGVEEESIYQHTSSTRPESWHYALCSMLDFWYTVTDEPNTADDPMRKALQSFANALALSIVRHDSAYEIYP